MLVPLKRCRVRSAVPFTCKPSAACDTASAASARATRACATFKLGLPAKARSTSPAKAVSPKLRHQSAPTAGVACESSPICAADKTCADGATPALLAQPVTVSTRLEASASERASAGSAAVQGNNCCGFICLVKYFGEY